MLPKSATMAHDFRVELQHLMTAHIDTLFSKLEDRLLQAQFEDRSFSDSGVVSALMASADLPTVSDHERRKIGFEPPDTAPGSSASPQHAKHATPRDDPTAQVLPSAAELPRTWEVIYSAREVLLPARKAIEVQQKAAEGYTALSTQEPSRANRLTEHQANHKLMLEQMSVDVDNGLLNGVTLALLGVGACIDGLAVDYGDRLPMWLEVLRLGSCVMFGLEIACRIYIQGPGFGFWNCSKRFWQWHWFQTMVVVAQGCEWLVSSGHLWFGFAVHPFHSSGTRQMLRVLASLRIVRTLHVVDNLDYGGEFHLMMASLSGSIISLGWASFFVVTPMFVFAMMLTQAVMDMMVTSREEFDSSHELRHYFGSLERSMLTLFESIAGGLSWEGAMFALRHHDFMWLSRGYIIFMVIVMFAVLNVVTGVFVTSAMASSDPEKRKAALVNLGKFFDAADADGSGTLDEPEFNFMVDTSKDLKLILQTLGIGHDEALELFELMDQDGSGELESDEFVKGVTKFQGQVSAIDFATFRNEFKAHTNKFDAYVKRVGQPA